MISKLDICYEAIRTLEHLPGISFALLLQNDNQAYQARQYLFVENEIGFMVRDSRFKYAKYDNGDEMLIDLQNDPGEIFNVAGQAKYREVQNSLKNHILKHIAKSNVKNK